METIKKKYVPTTVTQPLARKIMGELTGKPVRAVYQDCVGASPRVYEVTFVEKKGK